MFATAGGPSFADNPLTWSLFFARQPEPDLEFTEEELEQTTTVRSPSPVKPPKQSNKRPLIVVLLVLLLGGGAYLAMEPDLITEYLGPLLGDAPAQQPQPPVARKPTPPTPAPVPPAAPPKAVTPPPAPAVAPAETPQAATPTPTPVPTPPAAPPIPTASTPAPAPSAPSSIPAPTPAPQVVATPAPLFGEGQRVSVVPNPAAPAQKVPLSQDAEGTKPGPAVPPGTVFTILDGDLQENGWVYSVRSDFGTKGWLAEKQLKLKP
ncbi:MAG: hypothetical protein U0223_17665 [Nitrospira sp.]|nr:SH3 domain-containing protein [Nitrospira sp.]